MQLKFIKEDALNEVSLTQKISQAISQKGREYDNAVAARTAMQEYGSKLQQALQSAGTYCKAVVKNSIIDVLDTNGSICALRIRANDKGEVTWSYRACGKKWRDDTDSVFDKDAVTREDMAELLIGLIPKIEGGRINISEAYLTEGPVKNLIGKIASNIAKKRAEKAAAIQAGDAMGKLIADMKPFLTDVAQLVNSKAPGVNAVVESNTNGIFVVVKSAYVFEIDATNAEQVTLKGALDLSGQKVACKSVDEAIRAIAAAFKVKLPDSETQETPEIEENPETAEKTELTAEQQKILQTLQDMGVDLSGVDTAAFLQKLQA